VEFRADEDLAASQRLLPPYIGDAHAELDATGEAVTQGKRGGLRVTLDLADVDQHDRDRRYQGEAVDRDCDRRGLVELKRRLGEPDAARTPQAPFLEDARHVGSGPRGRLSDGLLRVGTGYGLDILGDRYRWQQHHARRRPTTSQTLHDPSHTMRPGGGLEGASS